MIDCIGIKLHNHRENCSIRQCTELESIPIFDDAQHVNLMFLSALSLLPGGVGDIQERHGQVTLGRSWLSDIWEGHGRVTSRRDATLKSPTSSTGKFFVYLKVFEGTTMGENLIVYPNNPFYGANLVRETLGQLLISRGKAGLAPINNRPCVGRTVKRGGAAAGTRKTARTTRGSQKAQNQPVLEVPEEPVRVEEIPVAPVEEKEDVKAEESIITQEKSSPAVEKNPVPVVQKDSDHKSELKLEPNGLRSKDRIKRLLVHLIEKRNLKGRRLKIEIEVALDISPEIDRKVFENGFFVNSPGCDPPLPVMHPLFCIDSPNPPLFQFHEMFLRTNLSRHTPLTLKDLESYVKKESFGVRTHRVWNLGPNGGLHE
ncbi:hypothetical protein G4B88_010795 [Cannabis sativa]|uniref:Uncharacterized protein n=1 Tax=Cannabis sativa TaxID=3483 RepID=A0A7J6GD20_CANSA|nr:hypothetical protein G4B88_010795 [Cannabis sativa]